MRFLGEFKSNDPLIYGRHLCDGTVTIFDSMSDVA